MCERRSRTSQAQALTLTIGPGSQSQKQAHIAYCILFIGDYNKPVLLLVGDIKGISLSSEHSRVNPGAVAPGPPERGNYLVY